MLPNHALNIQQIEKMKHTCVLLILIFSATFSFGQKTKSHPTKHPAGYVIQHVNIITMTSPDSVMNNATVVIVNNRIENINGAIPKNAQVIDGTGKWLMPGLIDMHVHLPADFYFRKKSPIQQPDLVFNTQDIMTPIIANGVTMVLDLNSNTSHIMQKKEIEKGYVIGPRMALAALIDGGERQGRIANSPEQGRQAVRSAKVEGYDFIKVYAYLNIETYLAIIDEANIQELKVVGHIPDAFAGKLKEAFVPGFSLVAHAEELANYAITFDEEEAKQMAHLLKMNGSWLSPTLIAMVKILSQVKSLDEIKSMSSLKYVHPLFQSKWLTANNYSKMNSPEDITHFDQYVKFNNLLVKACKEAGVPILAGSDAGVSGIVTGFALHDELELLVQAGLTPQEALNSATLLPAKWMGIDNQLGSVETGKLADLILLDQNPLTDINNTRKIAGVFVDGNWLNKSQLDSMLSDLAKRNTADKDKFDWKTMMNKGK
jgi:imidazolonepropionase-like amidohydrolase